MNPLIPEPRQNSESSGDTQRPTPSQPQPGSNDYHSTYNFVADKVGFVPNVRKEDNKLQAKVFLSVWMLCILIGLVWGGGDGGLTGALIGLVVALLISGAVLAVVGLRRTS
jgi:hypothetical protein